MRRVSRALIVKHNGHFDVANVKQYKHSKVGHMPSGCAIYARLCGAGRLMFFLSTYNKGEDTKNYVKG